MIRDDDAVDGGQRPIDAEKLVKGLSAALATSLGPEEVLNTIVQEAAVVVNCDHLFLSRYDPAQRIFQAIAWRSSINPGSVSLDQKFMGPTYLENLPVIVNDLAQYNYRLRPTVARLGLQSLVGIPFVAKGGMVGVLEAFSDHGNHFSDFDIQCLTLFANLAGTAMEKIDITRECKLRTAETEFLIEALKLEQASFGSLLYKVGETFGALFGVDGIAVFGIESEAAENPLQEVMAQGFAPADVARLKTLFSQKYLEQLTALPESDEHHIVKRSLRQPGPGGARLMYIVPIRYRRTLHGIIVFYWKEQDKVVDMANHERFIQRIIGDITVVLDRKNLYNNIQRMSFSDTLTGLANRRLFEYVLDRELKKAKRTTKHMSLLLIDIDYFKCVNDTFGHLVGDAVLEQVGAIIKDSCRNVDLAARFGGEEFAVILPETDRDKALAVAERVRVRLAEHRFQIGNQYITITVSVGGATYSSLTEDSTNESLTLAADEALYQAKQLGRNVVIYSGKA